MTKSAGHWSKKRYYIFEPEKVGLLLSVASALALFWFANKHGVEELIAMAAGIFLGTHVYLTPKYYGAEMDKVEREYRQDKNPFVLLMATFLTSLWAIAQFMI